MAGQKTMTVRKHEMMEMIWESDGKYVHCLDRKVLNKLIKDGMVKITNAGASQYHRKSVPIAVPTSPKPVAEEPKYTGGPYAKRRGYCEIAGLPYRGKTYGKVRRDKPREEREQKERDKKKMWAKLRGHPHS